MVVYKTQKSYKVMIKFAKVEALGGGEGEVLRVFVTEKLEFGSFLCKYLLLSSLQD